MSRRMKIWVTAILVVFVIAVFLLPVIAGMA